MQHYSTTINSFAIEHLESLGWKRGESIGKRQNGIAKHITVRKKTTRAGFGADKAINLNVGNHWWERVFDDLLNDDASDPMKQKNEEDTMEEYEVGIERKKGQSKSDRIMSKSMKTVMYTSMRFVRSTGKYGKDKFAEELERQRLERKEKKRRLQEDADEAKTHKKDKKRKRKDDEDSTSRKKKSKKDKKSAAPASPSSDSDTNDLTEKYHTRSSAVLSQSFFEACNGATLKKYRQVGKQNRLRAQEEALLKEWGMSK